jgi:hypothetical protein
MRRMQPRIRMGLVGQWEFAYLHGRFLNFKNKKRRTRGTIFLLGIIVNLMPNNLSICLEENRGL